MLFFRLNQKIVQTPDAIRNLYIRSNGGLVQLANVVRVEKTVAPKE